MPGEEDQVKQYPCKNFGCRLSFKWVSQLSDHKKVCVHTPKETVKKYELVDGRYKCSSCSSSYAQTKHPPHYCPYNKSEDYNQHQNLNDISTISFKCLILSCFVFVCFELF